MHDIDPKPPWLAEVRDCDRRADGLRGRQARIADERARIIGRAVAAYGRGGRMTAATVMEVSVAQIDAILTRYRALLAAEETPR